MKTLKIFWKHEWITLWRKPFLIGGGILFYISLFFALGNGWQSVNTTVGEQREIASATAERSEELRMSFATGDGPSLTPYDVGGKLAKRYIFKEPTPFAFLSIGQQELFASEYSISLRDTDFSILNGGGEVGNPLINYLGAFDFTFVIIWLLPLLIILYMYDVVSGERESGTLALLLSQPLSLSRLLWLKLVVKFGFLAIYLLTGMLIGFGIFGWEVFTETGSLLIFLGGILLYCLFWFGLSVLINQLRMSSMANLSMLFLGWLLFVLLIPTSLGLISDSRYAVPSRLQLVNDLKVVRRRLTTMLHGCWTAFILIIRS